MDNPNDVKELIPEFFYFPEFLENQNGKLTAQNILIQNCSCMLQRFVNVMEHFLFKFYSVLVEINHHAGFKLFNEDASCVKQQPKHCLKFRLGA